MTFVTVLGEGSVSGERLGLGRTERGEALFQHWLSDAGTTRLRAEEKWMKANRDRIATALTARGQ